ILAARTAFAQRTPRGILVAEGDSWFDYPGADLLEVLQDDAGYEVASAAHWGDSLESMSYDDAQLTGFVRQLEWVKAREEVPKAVLLSGGGNDFAGPEFGVFIGHKNSESPGVDEALTENFIGGRLQS